MRTGLLFPLQTVGSQGPAGPGNRGIGIQQPAVERRQAADLPVKHMLLLSRLMKMPKLSTENAMQASMRTAT